MKQVKYFVGTIGTIAMVFGIATALRFEAELINPYSACLGIALSCLIMCLCALIYYQCVEVEEKARDRMSRNIRALARMASDRYDE